MAELEVYKFELDGECPCRIELKDAPDGMYLSSEGSFEKGDGPKIMVNENIAPGDYMVKAVVIDKNGARSDDPLFGQSEAGGIGPISIYADSFDAVKNLTNDLYVQFQDIEVCEGDCNSTNNYFRYGDDNFDYVNQSYKLNRIISEENELIWRYTGISHDFGASASVPNFPMSGHNNGNASGVLNPIYYERNFTGENPLDNCECGTLTYKLD